MCKGVVGKVLSIAAIAQQCEDASSIVRTQKVHQAVGNCARIGRVNFGKDVIKGLGIAILDECENRVAERIIHHTIELTPRKIAAAASVSRFVNGIFPYLANNKTFACSVFLHHVAQFVEKFVREFVGNVESPSVNATVCPLGNDALLTRKIAATFLVLVIETGQNFDAPPALVLLGKRTKVIPLGKARIL